MRAVREFLAAKNAKVAEADVIFCCFSERDAALALKDVFIQVVSSEQSGRFTKVSAKMSPSDIKWLIENKFTILKEIGSDYVRVVESDDGLVSIEVGLTFERRKDLSYHDVMFDVFYGSDKTETAEYK